MHRPTIRHREHQIVVLVPPLTRLEPFLELALGLSERQADAPEPTRKPRFHDQSDPARTQERSCCTDLEFRNRRRCPGAGSVALEQWSALRRGVTVESF
jgi:hypothetical protein